MVDFYEKRWLQVFIGQYVFSLFVVSQTVALCYNTTTLYFTFSCHHQVRIVKFFKLTKFCHILLANVQGILDIRCGV